MTESSVRHLLQQHLEEELTLHPEANSVACEAMAAAVACLEGMGPAPVWSSDVLALAVGRALNGAGEQELAAKALVSLGGRRLQAMAAEPGVGALPWSLLARSILRPDVYSSVPAPAWTLDLRRIAISDEDHFELGRLFFLRELLNLVAPAFDAHRGCGSLILLGLEQRDPSWLRTSVEIMRHLADTRRWSQSPVVLRGALAPLKKSA